VYACVAIFSQLAKGDIFAPDLAPAALGGEKQSQSGRRTHKKGQQRVRPSSKKQQLLFKQPCVFGGGRTALARLSLLFLPTFLF
jgi:hypothetical protein